MGTDGYKNERTSSAMNPAMLLVFKAGALVSIAVIALAVIFSFSNRKESSSPTESGALSGTAVLPGQFAFQVGTPGPGQPAPPFQLASTNGSSFNLATLRGQTVLLYFQEGVMCQPCWDQLKDIEANFSQLQALGIDQVVSITTDPLNALQQKAELEGLSTPVLSDPTLAVSQAYTTNKYGMMGERYNGHSFLLVGPDGRIQWRADYGGAPNYTMYVPLPNLIADLRQGLQGGSK